MKKLIYLPLLLICSCIEKAPETCKFRLQMYGSEEYVSTANDIRDGVIFQYQATRLLLPYIDIVDGLDCGYQPKDTIKVKDKNGVVLQKLKDE